MTAETEVPEANSKEPTTEQDGETELESAIIRQVEYYFGDANLPRDKFLREQIQLDEGWVPVEILLKFNRLNSITNDTEAVAKALLKSTTGLLEVSEDNKKVRRHPELPVPELNEERRKELSDRTLYMKGFPKDATLDELLEFLKKHDVEHVIMRKYQERNTRIRQFKGSVFVLFKTKEKAEEFIGLKDLKYKEKDLLVLWQDAYNKQKNEEYTMKKELKDKKHKDKEQKSDKTQKEELKLPTGCVLHFSQGTDKMKREDIKDALAPFGGEVAYIDFKVGDTEGWVRFTKENAAIEVNKKIPDGKLKVTEAEVVFKLLEGDEEKAYLDKTIEEMTKRRRNMKQNKFNKGKNFKGNRGQGRKRRQDNDDGPPSKVKADS